MDSWTGRKRPWEEDNPIDFQFKRRGSSTNTGERRPPPLPQPAGHYSRDSQTPDHRTLPPLYTPSCSASAEQLASSSLRAPPLVQAAPELGKPRPRSQSLFDVFQQPTRQGQDIDSEHTKAFPGALGLDRSLPPIGNDPHRPHFDTDPAPHAVGALICCPSNCEGQPCSSTRTLMRKLASELIDLDTKH
ncbi:uncharacterized protein BDR25DRAFT_66886 [Lindgomyces ingoldianus]|uniref:Uncharacterized protein n=1 Tax=Lindgomyces ingoldianus TaxID=673940 RepID=A0ACB6RB17_9PLEO|nr:uncharacterized protein BDR25DRAFT_66886 [Lindgomyces ingoldianus]KAF2476509.1 hypothetical protein BDR25DRAFT_66886 [Lindgomyces ingoldianus]